MAPDRYGSKHQTRRKDEGTGGRSSHGVHACQGAMYASPDEDDRKHNPERDNLIKMKVERKESRRPGAGDVDDPSGALCRQASSTRKLGDCEEAEEGNRGCQKGQ